ncbi:hypothetical protein [Pseudosporangium ferrugineum]|uniref:Uncharacterized protein n=1 Tax=Pseudosporangium ferrugineum TaxID=439699 RepID=A0A2T0SJ25_9ACTN|nr:hypothetical protein [Pseudosporangium ferrugineum]PRY33416.1 hypothetical protein CLV70_101578 [Pseudosporangium ferrugineum]
MNLDQALRDAAEPVPPRVGQPPARRLLESIVTSPVPPPAARTDGLSPRAVRRTRRTVLAVLAAGVAAAAAFLVPNLGAGAAYASWTPRPAPLPAADRADLGDRCAAQVRATFQGVDGAPSIVHGEKRGDYAYVSVVTPAWTATCFRDRDGAVRQASIMMAPVGAATLGGAGVEMQSWAQLRTGEGLCRLMTGHVGAQVTGVEITVPEGRGGPRVVQATVEDGYFLAWYPEKGQGHGTTVTLRLADGRTVEGLSAKDLHDAPVTD